MDLVTAKFYCEQVVQHETSAEVYMRPDFPKDDNSDHPNRAFWQATPSGRLQMCITNQAAVDRFEQGAVYTVTFAKDEELQEETAENPQEEENDID